MNACGPTTPDPLAVCSRRSRLLAIVAAIAVVGCGRSDVIEPSPQKQVEMPLKPVCQSTCTVPPPGAKTPFQTTPSNRPLHWLPCGQCLRVTVDPTLSESVRQVVPSVAAAWSDASKLCVSFDPTPVAADENENHRIHVGPLDESKPARVMTTVHFDATTARIRAARIEVQSNVGFAPNALNFAFGQVFGLGRSNDDDSALSVNSDRTTPGTPDIDSLRAMYDAPAWCTR